MNRLRPALVGIVLCLAVVLAVAAPSAASYHGDRPTAALHHNRGGCIHNTDTHVLDCIKGWHKFHRTVHGHRKTFWEPVVSAQRCQHSGCWGRIWSGTMPHRYRLGRKGLVNSRGGCGGFFSPWAICWANDHITHAVEQVDRHVVKPCVFGSARGFGGALVWNLTIKALLRGSVVTAAQAGKYFTGPAGFAIVTVATCGVGVYNKGLDRVEGIFSG
jgi:hypothetical protein